MATDNEPRVVVTPRELAETLAGDGQAAVRFAAMSYTHQREYAEWVAEAKKPETRLRRAAKAIEMINEGKSQR